MEKDSSFYYNSESFSDNIKRKDQKFDYRHPEQPPAMPVLANETAYIKTKGIDVRDKGRKEPLFYIFLTIFMLTVAFTALSCGLLKTFGDDPREKAGEIAADLIFGDIRNESSAAESMYEDILNTETNKTETEAAENQKNTDTVTDSVTTPADPSVTAEHQIIENICPLFKNETDHKVDIDDVADKNQNDISSYLSNSSLLILCTHSSEKFADGCSVIKAAEAIFQALDAAGIKAELCYDDFDISGRIGSYRRARIRIEEYISNNKNPIILDLHIGDSQKLIIGGDGDKWQINTSLAAFINNELGIYSADVMLKEGSYNQDVSALSIHAELDGSKNEVSGTKSARILADAIVGVYRRFFRQLSF